MSNGVRTSNVLLTRRGLMEQGGVMTLTTALFGVAPAHASDTKTGPKFATDGPFNRSTVIEIARALAKKPFRAPQDKLPEQLTKLTYDQYRDIRFKPDRAIWAKTGLPFQMELFHSGFYFKDPVEVALVDNGQARHVAYDPDMFTFGPLVPKPMPQGDFGFAGIRIHAPINRKDYYDEVCAFQGASYFRAVGRGQVYGLSARGLAIKVADPEGEEFPAFRAFWVETPSTKSDSLVIYALLDSQSCSGAYRFTLSPGLPTRMDVEVSLFPRVALGKLGLAPGTSMYYFSDNSRHDIDDFRPQVHDSDGLLMQTGRNERIWRPLANPARLQISAFADTGPRGFGLMQRDRSFDDYEDLESSFERRPSLWIEPVGDWGAGAVTLVEIPSNSEIHDNIVAYWAPKTPIPANSEYNFAYRTHWGLDPDPPPGMVIVAATRSGRANIAAPSAERLFVIDYFAAAAPGANPAPAPTPLPMPKANVTASVGKISDVSIRVNDKINGWRLSFHLDPANETSIELRSTLAFDDNRPVETWVYRWTA